MEKLICPFADQNSDFCCHIALNEEESYENCHDCAIKMYIDLAEFIEYLRLTKRK